MSLSKPLLCLVLFVSATQASCLVKGMEFDCSELGPGASQSYEQTFQVRNKFVATLVVTVETSNPGTAAAPKCHVKYTVTGRLAGKTRILFRHQEEPASSANGVSVNGTSPDGSKLLLDFFSTRGDLTEHRPVVYDFLSGGWQIRDVGNRVTRDFPKCDYFTMIQSVTNDGDVVLYVPKSIYASQGCPDQGEWLLNMRTNEITRVEKAGATQP